MLLRGSLPSDDFGNAITSRIEFASLQSATKRSIPDNDVNLTEMIRNAQDYKHTT